MSFRGAQACPSEKGRRLEGWKVGGLAKNKKRRVQGVKESRVRVENVIHGYSW